jgi:hypothetical protein
VVAARTRPLPSRPRKASARGPQLTSDRSRTDARRFWTGLGLTASHVGFKRPL